MNWALAAILGIAGAVAHDVFELATLSRNRRHTFSEEWTSPAFMVASAIRVAAGGVLAGVLGGIGEVGALGAILVGALAPLMVQRLAGMEDNSRETD